MELRIRSVWENPGRNVDRAAGMEPRSHGRAPHMAAKEKLLPYSQAVSVPKGDPEERPVLPFPAGRGGPTGRAGALGLPGRAAGTGHNQQQARREPRPRPWNSPGGRAGMGRHRRERVPEPPGMGRGRSGPGGKEPLPADKGCGAVWRLRAWKRFHTPRLLSSSRWSQQWSPSFLFSRALKAMILQDIQVQTNLNLHLCIMKSKDVVQREITPSLFLKN
ncbi:translation initiation factor IF-2-like isoform X3 [Corapipo altera]|uniref:translation initiation factor IF-2-like isoform X3 n=1 Tax=Corapipo altera TaxID=415028 RepID=UPI000FD69F72|nr:translation initiation factor IF-2-like isoform X3 [Corapipo altera]